MANPRLKGYAKFFLGPRKVVFMGLMKDAGTLTVAPGTVTLDKTDKRVFTASDPKVVPLMGKISAVIIVGEYADKADDKAAYGSTQPDRLDVPTAQLQTTVTNDPPGGPTPIPYDVDEVEDTPTLTA
jgi:hypothetical protein